MNLNQTIKNCFQQINSDNGTVIYNATQNKNFTGLITSGDFISSFTEGDQDTELNFQITMFNDEAPKTGDKLIIDGKKYIVQTVQNRTNGVISKITVYETKSKK